MRTDSLKLVRDFVAVGVLVVLLLLVAWSTMGSTTHGYDASVLLKHHALQRSGSPKIVFVGGSNVSYGLDSELLEQHLDVPVVNMGLNASIGLPIQLADIEYQLQSGDSVVIVPEYETLRQTVYNNGAAANALLHNPSAAKRLVYQRDVVALHGVARSIPFAVSRNIRFGLERSIRPELASGNSTQVSFNAYGDYLTHLSSDATMEGADIALIAEHFLAFEESAVDEAVVTELNRFYSDVKDAGVSVYMMYPCVIDEYYAHTESYMNVVHSSLQAQLDIPILNEPNSCVLPASEFFDTKYHLTKSGREYRTKHVIDRLGEL